jgi:hypothetical protein
MVAGAAQEANMALENTMSITLRERNRIKRAAAELLKRAGGFPPTPEGQVALAAELAEAIEDHCPRLAQALSRIRFEPGCDYLVVHNLPSAEAVAPLVHLATSAFVGHVFNFSSQNGGALAMRLEPRADSEANTNTTADEFALHTDDAAMPEEMRVSWISLYGVRNPRGTYTGYAPVEAALSRIDLAYWNTLRSPSFEVRMPRSFKLGDDIWTEPRAILGVDEHGCTTIAWPSYATRVADPRDVEAAEALAALKDAMEREVVWTALQPGTMLVFSNAHGAHKRTAIGAGERLILRNYIRPDLSAMRAKAGHAGHVFSLHTLLDLPGEDV